MKMEMAEMEISPSALAAGPSALALRCREDPSDPNFVSFLPEPLRGYALRAFPPPDADGSDGISNAASRLDELEISARSRLLELVEWLPYERGEEVERPCGDDGRQNLPPSSNTGASTVEALLRYVKDVTLLCLHAVQQTSSSHNGMMVASSAIKKIPFLLLEDAVDSLPIVYIQALWSSPQYPTLNVSSYTTSLLCSPLIFVNNTKLVMLRICNKLLKFLSNRDVDAEFAGSIMTMMAKVFPLSERSAVNVLGSFNVHNETTFESEKEFDGKAGDSMLGMGEEKDQESAVEKGGCPGGSDVSYDFYRTFWGVQSVFTNPQGTILSSKGGPSDAAAANALERFMKDVTSILEALESIPIPKSLSFAKSRLDGSTDCGLVARHHKYLTSSRLLRLQFSDADLRIHFLTQLLIVLSYLSAPSVVLPAPSVTLAPGSDPTKLAAQIMSARTKKLVGMEKRAWEMLRTTSPPLGEGMGRFLSWLLRERETMWRSWKGMKCTPAMDRAGTTTASGAEVKALLGAKRKISSALKMEDISMKDLTKASAPAFNSFLEPYIEALDPENGIDAEYHPRKDHVYCWRALRLMARDLDGEGQLMRFGKLRRKDGDFEAVVRAIWKDRGEDIGGSLPKGYYSDSGGKGQIKDGVSKDEAMDDASVGTPEGDAEAKKSKMAEFERAAMEVEKEMLNEESKDTVKDEDDEDEKDEDIFATVKEEVEEGTKEDNCPIRDAAADTVESTLAKAMEKGSGASENLKLPPPKTASASSKGEEKVVVMKEKTSKPLSSKGQAMSAKNRGQFRDGVNKDEDNVIAVMPNGTIKKTEVNIAPEFNAANLSKSQREDPNPSSSVVPSPPRPKFTPPPPKSTPQQHPLQKDESRVDYHHPKKDPRDDLRSYELMADHPHHQKNEGRDNSRGRFSSRREFRSNNSENCQQHHQQPSERRGLGGDGDFHHQQDRSRDSGGGRSRAQQQSQRDSGWGDKGGDHHREHHRDHHVKSHSPPSHTGGSGEGNPSSSEGGRGGGGSDRRNLDRTLPPRGGRGGGRGGWEPPHSGRAGGRGGGGRGRGNYRDHRRRDGGRR